MPRKYVDNSLSNLPEILEEYESYFAKFKDEIFPVAGKELQQAHKDQMWLGFYIEKKAEIKTVLHTVETKLESVRGKLTRQYLENYSRELSERLIEKYLNNEEEYIKYKQLYRSVEEVYEKMSAIIDAFQQRGYSLKNITDARIHQIQAGVL